jgi:hypothetical protein
VDPRLATAIDASRRWYDLVFAAHGVRCSQDDELWWATDQPPPWHSAVKSLRPGVHRDRVLAAMERHPRGSVADSFGSLQLAQDGFELLFDATWLHHGGAVEVSWPDGWSIVSDADVLGAWCEAHDPGVLSPAVFADGRIHVLAYGDEVGPTAGAILHDAGTAVGLSNLWAVGDAVDAGLVAGALACIEARCGGRPVTTYAYGAALEAMLAAGFTAIGPHRVWAR